MNSFFHYLSISSHNVFTFNGSHYLQVQGVVMGTCCCALSYANLYLGEREQMFLADENLAICTDYIVGWFCYIDAILIFWDAPPWYAWSVPPKNEQKWF